MPTSDLRVPVNTPMLLTRRVTCSASGTVLAPEETRLSSQDTRLAFPVAVVTAAPHTGGHRQVLRSPRQITPSGDRASLDCAAGTTQTCPLTIEVRPMRSHAV